MVAKFPHFIFRCAVVLALLLFIFQGAVDHAAHETICCASPTVVRMANILESYRAILGLASVILMVLALAFPCSIVLIAYKAIKDQAAFQGLLPFVIDGIFGVGASLGVYLVLVMAMGHSDVNWARGFRSAWVAMVFISGATLVLTIRGSQWPKLRVVLWVLGLFLSLWVPTHFVDTARDLDGLVEYNRLSTIYIFRLLLTTLFWMTDVFLSGASRVANFQRLAVTK